MLIPQTLVIVIVIAIVIVIVVRKVCLTECSRPTRCVATGAPLQHATEAFRERAAESGSHPERRPLFLAQVL